MCPALRTVPGLTIMERTAPAATQRMLHPGLWPAGFWLQLTHGVGKRIVNLGEKVRAVRGAVRFRQAVKEPIGGPAQQDDQQEGPKKPPGPFTTQPQPPARPGEGQTAPQLFVAFGTPAGTAQGLVLTTRTLDPQVRPAGRTFKGCPLVVLAAFRTMDGGILLRTRDWWNGFGIVHSSFRNSVSSFEASSCAKLSSSTVWTRRL